MKSLILVLFTVLLFTAILSDGKQERQPLHITSLTIKFDKTDAIFTVNYDIENLPKMYIFLLGSKSLEPKIKSVFSNFDYEIVKMDQDKAILKVKNIARFDKGYYLHDSRRFGEGINALNVYIYTPDSPEPKRYSSQYLFGWDNVPGNESFNENFKLRTFLKDNLDINLLDNAKIPKSDDGSTIRVYDGEKSVEITLDKNKKKAILKTSDVGMYELIVKEEDGKFSIYSPYMYSTPNIYYRS